MKSKLLLCLALVLSSGFTAFGVSTIIQVNPTNMASMPFVIKVQDEGTSKLFDVIVDPQGVAGDGHGASLSAYLEVYDGTNQISSSDIKAGKLPPAMRNIKAPLAERGVLFEFVIATNYLEHSQFNISYQLNDYPAFNGYLFKLKDFAKP